ncbi:MAG: SDR family oxidoreductase [Halanaerobiaceae bacterium]
MKILVTGGAGFIGSHIVDRLILLGHDVIIADNLSSGRRENINRQAVFFNLDITSPELKKIFQKNKISHVIHHAARIDVQLSLDNPVDDARNNILGSLNLLECCRQYGVEKFVYASSAAVYGEPDYLPVDEEHPLRAMSPYGISKHVPEHYVRMYGSQYNLKYTILRYSNVYGPRQGATGEGGVISIFINRMLNGKRPYIYGDGEQTRDFIFVEDVVSANVEALSRGNKQLMNISSNNQFSINELYTFLRRIISGKPEACYRPQRDGDIENSRLDNSRARKILDWEPEYDLYQGLRETVKYYTEKSSKRNRQRS